MGGHDRVTLLGRERVEGRTEDDMRSDGLIAFVVPPVSAADAFRHPFRYAP